MRRLPSTHIRPSLRTLFLQGLFLLRGRSITDLELVDQPGLSGTGEEGHRDGGTDDAVEVDARPHEEGGGECEEAERGGREAEGGLRH